MTIYRLTMNHIGSSKTDKARKDWSIEYKFFRESTEAFSFHVQHLKADQRLTLTRITDGREKIIAKGWA